MDTNSLILIGSEVALALYPILIKTIPVNLATQLVARFLVYVSLAFFLATPSDIAGTWLSFGAASQSMTYGLLTLVHIGVSYYSFANLPTGTAMSLFYTYPVWNLLGAYLLFGETFSLFNLFLIFVALFGVFLVSLKTNEEDTDSKKQIHLQGVVAALMAAVTESLTYLIVRVKSPSPSFSILQLYPGGLLLLLSGLLATGETIDLSWTHWKPLLLFNALIGFVGYFLRFYTIPRVDTLVFSLLSFIGVIASYIWGFGFLKEVPTSMGVLGSLLISLAAGFAVTK
jgi:drug/metabolite transporter (DMT)-like permease